MRKYRIYIEPDTAADINCAYYMENSHRAIIQSIITNPNLDINEELFKQYCNEYMYAYMYYEECKYRIEYLYIGELVDRFECTWNLNFNSRVLTVTVTDGNDDSDMFFRRRGFERIG